jgi:hypothetical protein
MDGRLAIAVDGSGGFYFKRMRVLGTIVVLESVNSDGTTPDILKVAGVLSELPN